MRSEVQVNDSYGEPYRAGSERYNKVVGEM